jgi:hypothetical protein
VHSPLLRPAGETRSGAYEPVRADGDVLAYRRTGDESAVVRLD